MKKEQSGMHLDKILFAVALGLLAHAFIGYFPYPFGDDFAYAPLADYRADPTLFARDDQLRLFANHAKAYDWLYALGTATFGVELVFRIAVWVLAAGVAVALYVLLAALGAPLLVLPAALGLGVVVKLDGMGRGDFGGLISPFFHHHNLALALVLGAISAACFRKSWLAGILLGAAVFAQPMTAFHGAMISGFGALLRHPGDVVKMAIAAVFVALPAALPILSSLLATPDTVVSLDIINDAYRFRAPHHYDPTWHSIGVAAMYLLAGIVGSLQLMRSDASFGRFALGVMISFALLHMVTVFIYKMSLSDWVPLFILDANRSTPVLFVIGPAVALAGLLRLPWSLLHWANVCVLLGIFLLNGTLAGLGFIALSLLMWRLPQDVRMKSLLAIGLATVLLLTFPAKPSVPPVPVETRQALEDIRAVTPRDALFVIPISLSEFRLIAQRSAYVDFKLFSVAQPEQAALTRERIDQIVDPSPENRDAKGWLAAMRWSADQRQAATCDSMTETLKQTGADYFLRYVAPDETPQDCPQLARVVQSKTLVLYGPSR
ncbi:MAG: DUF6798 domain-containing protein [Pseudomonadota bacterium]